MEGHGVESWTGVVNCVASGRVEPSTGAGLAVKALRVVKASAVMEQVVVPQPV